MAKWTVTFTDTDQPEVKIEADKFHWNDGVVTALKDGEVMALFNAHQVLGVQVDEAEPKP